MMKRYLSLCLVFICSMAACRKNSGDSGNGFTGTFWDGAFVHANSNPSTEEPFRIRFTTKDSLVYSSIDGTFNGAYTINTGKIHIDLNNGAFIMDATIKGSDSLVSFQNTKTGDFSFKRAHKVKPGNTLPAGKWIGLYSMASSVRVSFTVPPYVTFEKDVFNSGNDWFFVYVYQYDMLSIYNAGVKGKYFALMQDTVIFGSFNPETGTNRTSFTAKKQP